MFVTGFIYILLAAPYFLNKKMNLNLNYFSLFIHKGLFITGSFLIIISIIGLFFENKTLWLTVSLIFILIFIIKLFINYRHWKNSLEVMQELED